MSIDVLAANEPAGPSAALLASGTDWAVAEYVCASGPGERPFEERHNTFSIALVTDGTFRYRAQQGTSLLHPGALLLGNHGTCYECGHDHSTGDRCLAFHFGPALFAEVAASATGRASYVFDVPTMPATAYALPILATARRIAGSDETEWLHEAGIGILESVLGAASGQAPRRQDLSKADERRISEALAIIATQYGDALTLEGLSTAVSMSKYHFLRTFRRVTGHSPHQYVLRHRLVRAAARLAATAEPVSAIAFDTGFGDLSTFNAQFRRAFGETPTRFRNRHLTRTALKR